jgi:hypothetical protein
LQIIVNSRRDGNRYHPAEKGPPRRGFPGGSDAIGSGRRRKWCPEEKTIIASNKLLLFFKVDLVFLDGTSAGITNCVF